jgi:hypothetical protein
MIPRFEKIYPAEEDKLESPFKKRNYFRSVCTNMFQKEVESYLKEYPEFAEKLAVEFWGKIDPYGKNKFIISTGRGALGFRGERGGSFFRSRQQAEEALKKNLHLRILEEAFNRIYKSETVVIDNPDVEDISVEIRTRNLPIRGEPSFIYSASWKINRVSNSAISSNPRLLLTKSRRNIKRSLAEQEHKKSCQDFEFNPQEALRF